MALQPLRVGFRLSNIHHSKDEGDHLVLPRTYLWTVFFKLDGNTTSVGNNLMLQGTATIMPLPGNHDDLGTSEVLGDVPIPGWLGEVRTVLSPIPFQSIPHVSTGGVIGCFAILNTQAGTPDDAISAGHNKLISAFASELNKLIPTLGPMKTMPTNEDIDGIKHQVEDQVKHTIGDNVSFWDWLASQGSEDRALGAVILIKPHSDLADAPATGVEIDETMSFDVSSHTIHEKWRFTGRVFADPLDFSLRRFMVSVGLNPANGIRAPMLSGSFVNVRKWIMGRSPTLSRP
jgi:hypothetical protein